MKLRLRRFALPVIIWLVALGAAAGDLVPFGADLQTVPVPTGLCGPGCIAFEIGGNGQATHMGRTEIAGPSHVQLDATDPTLGTQTGTSTLTAANGDAIVIAFAGTVHFLAPPPTGAVSFEGTWELIDGTGRFEGANGSGTYSGTAEGPAGDLRLVGRVSSPGTNK
jgi:hypothetical protein